MLGQGIYSSLNAYIGSEMATEIMMMVMVMVMVMMMMMMMVAMVMVMVMVIVMAMVSQTITSLLRSWELCCSFSSCSPCFFSSYCAVADGVSLRSWELWLGLWGMMNSTHMHHTDAISLALRN